MKKVAHDSGILKLIIGWGAVFLFRLILLPIRPPNIEPMMATLMPFSKRFGALTSFFFAAVGIVIYDSVTSGIGMWTMITAVSYGLVGIAAHWYFTRNDANVRNFVAFSIVATLTYDAATGLTLGPLFFHQSFMTALIGQIPFTVLHLIGNVTFAAVLSPAIYSWIVTNPSFEYCISKKSSAIL